MVKHDAERLHRFVPLAWSGPITSAGDAENRRRPAGASIVLSALSCARHSEPRVAKPRVLRRMCPSPVV
ncbi:MAG: hypothetical protein D6744_08200 [Planctomycetota bacterium]|nr:MAG: hypothetical protein D6744_08200 [Planctomycetota bacterium]